MAVVTEKPAFLRLTSMTRRLFASPSTSKRCCFATGIGLSGQGRWDDHAPPKALSTFSLERMLDTSPDGRVWFALMSEDQRRFARKALQVDFRGKDAQGAGE